MIRAFWSELLKLRRWSILVSAGVMITATAAIAYFTFHKITAGYAGPEIAPLIHAFPTTQGLVTIIETTQALLVVFALTIVTANMAAEWSQGTLRNLLVREPDRLRLLAGKILALWCFLTVILALTLLVSTTFILLMAHVQGIQTSAWTSPEGLSRFLGLFSNELLCFIGMSLFGTLIAVLTRSTTAAVAIALAYTLIEGLLATIWPEGAEWLPIRLFNVLVGSTVPAAVGPTPLQGYTAAFLAGLVWMMGFVVVSAVAFQRQDVKA